MDFDGITMSTAAISAIVGGVGTWLKMRPRNRFVTCDQCAEHRAAIEKRIDEIGPALGRVFKKLDENDKRAEDRSEKLHRRLDPIVEKVAANSAEIQAFKEIAAKAAIGGQK